MNAYIESVIETVKKKHGSEPEFVQTVEEVLSSLDPVVSAHPEYEAVDLLGRMVEPERMFTFRVVWTDDAGKTHTIIGVSGTVTTMTALAMGLTEYDHTAVDGARCTLEDAYAVDDRFLHMPREERLTYKTIHPGRVDVVGGGALVWNRVLAKVSEAAYEDHGQRIDSFMASEHGLLDGIVLDYGKRLLAAR